MNTYTPGPWKLVLDERKEVLGIYASHQNVVEDWMDWVDPNGDVIVETDSGHYPPKLEDARLIAAAPELLEALKNLLHAFPGEYTEAPTHITNARAAIAKATGQNEV